MKKIIIVSLLCAVVGMADISASTAAGRLGSAARQGLQATKQAGQVGRGVVRNATSFAPKSVQPMVRPVIQPQQPIRQFTNSSPRLMLSAPKAPLMIPAPKSQANPQAVWEQAQMQRKALEQINLEQLAKTEQALAQAVKIEQAVAQAEADALLTRIGEEQLGRLETKLMQDVNLEQLAKVDLEVAAKEAQRAEELAEVARIVEKQGQEAEQFLARAEQAQANALETAEAALTEEMAVRAMQKEQAAIDLATAQAVEQAAARKSLQAAEFADAAEAVALRDTLQAEQMRALRDASREVAVQEAAVADLAAVAEAEAAGSVRGFGEVPASLEDVALQVDQAVSRFLSPEEPLSIAERAARETGNYVQAMNAAAKVDAVVARVMQGLKEGVQEAKAQLSEQVAPGLEAFGQMAQEANMAVGKQLAAGLEAAEQIVTRAVEKAAQEGMSEEAMMRAGTTALALAATVAGTAAVMNVQQEVAERIAQENREAELEAAKTRALATEIAIATQEKAAADALVRAAVGAEIDAYEDACVVAERLGYESPEALTQGVAAIQAESNARLEALETQAQDLGFASNVAMMNELNAIESARENSWSNYLWNKASNAKNYVSSWWSSPETQAAVEPLRRDLAEAKQEIGAAMATAQQNIESAAQAIAKNEQVIQAAQAVKEGYIEPLQNVIQQGGTQGVTSTPGLTGMQGGFRGFAAEPKRAAQPNRSDMSARPVDRSSLNMRMDNAAHRLFYGN